MENIFKALGTLCISAYVMGVIVNVSDSERTKKTVSLVLSLCVLTCFIHPLGMPVGFDFSSYDDYRPNAGKERQEYVIEAASDKLENEIEEKLKEKNISYTKVLVHINNQDESLKADKAVIYGLDKTDLEKAERAVSEVLPGCRTAMGE